MDTVHTPQTHKFAVILNKKLDTGVALNAASHLMAALVNKAVASQRELMQFVDYIDADGSPHPVSALSLIVLRADSSNKIRTARQAAKLAGLLCVDFIESMTGGTAAEQQERTASLSENDLNYYGVAMFGEVEILRDITSKLSLWR